MVLDLERIEQPDEAWDVVVVCHVLEHVDDRRALREVHRILRPGGTLVAQVPIVDGWSSTYENPAMRTKRERELHFGQSDHLRLFGADFIARVEDAGFIVEEFVASGEQCVTFGLTRGEKVHLARRSP
jgi:SAM-dependent methyltransferase